MSNSREDFAPFWLAMSILEDTASCDAVEVFIAATHHVHGRLYVHNKRTGSIYEDAADRYASTVVFLASLWSRSDQYTMSANRGETLLDTKHLFLLNPPPSFERALQLGEEKYREEQSRHALTYANDQSSYGHWEWQQVWVVDYP